MIDSNDPFFWGGLNDSEELNKEQNEAIAAQKLALSNQFAKCFRTPAGKQVLEKLESMTIKMPSWLPDHANPRDFGMMREGQNSLVWYIKDRIEESLNAHKN